jgi:hypothetical protein
LEVIFKECQKKFHDDKRQKRGDRSQAFRTEFRKVTHSGIHE